jgi:hypothetical protein
MNPSQHAPPTFWLGTLHGTSSLLPEAALKAISGSKRHGSFRKSETSIGPDRLRYIGLSLIRAPGAGAG